MDLTDQEFTVDDHPFRLTFQLEDGRLRTRLEPTRDDDVPLTSAISNAWLLCPADLLEFARQGEDLRVGEICSFYRDEDESPDIHVELHGHEQSVTAELFFGVVTELALAHLEMEGPDRYPAWSTFSPAWQSELLAELNVTT